MSIFKNHPFLNQLKIIEVDDEYEEDDWQENVREKLSMMCGNSIVYLLGKPDILEPLFVDATKEDEKRLWALLKQVWDFVHGPSSSYTDANLANLQGVLNEITCLYQIYKVHEPLYLHYIVHHMVPMLKKLRELGLSFGDIDQGAFELLNKFWKEMRRGCVPMSIAKTRNSKKYQESIDKYKWIDYQKVLNFKENMGYLEYSEYKDRSEALHFLLLGLRSFYLCSKYPNSVTLKPLPDFDRKKYTSKSLEKSAAESSGTTLTPNPKFMFSPEQMELWCDVPKSKDFDYAALEAYYKKNSKSIQAAKKERNINLLMDPTQTPTIPSSSGIPNPDTNQSRTYNPNLIVPEQQPEENLEFHQIEDDDGEVDSDAKYQELLVRSMEKRANLMAEAKEISKSQQPTSQPVVPQSQQQPNQTPIPSLSQVSNAPTQIQSMLQPPAKRARGATVSSWMAEENAF